MKPSILVLGGCGFIGRNLVDYLIRENLVDYVCVADKVPPQIAWLNTRHQETFADPRVQFKSVNLLNAESCHSVFLQDNGEAFEYVVNCAGETKSNQTDRIYKEGIYDLSLQCAKRAAEVGVKRFLEISSGYMGSNSKVPLREDDKKEPWTSIAKWKAAVEDSLKNIENLNYAVIRPAIVYGYGDKTGLMPLVVIGAIYKHLDECMKWLWTSDLKMNTIHVIDVCRAVWHVIQLDSSICGEVFHVVDDSNASQGLLADLISDLFKISHDFLGTARSMLVKVDLIGVMEEINDKHLGPWAELCNLNEINCTPLSPFLNKELVNNKHLFLDGTKLKSTGFQLSVPFISAQNLKEVLDDYSVMNLFPSSVLS